ncbi:transglutaminase-like domain-containing protein [Providencia manganoxydans]|uniref:Transglutaminase-like domain-containing protein n=2 Tax=Providencia stuartii TaxID=588 RepID=A0A1S1HKC0_PROST|nr:hypothetical protein A3Q29_09600 [Providencia stuartii]
MLNSIRSKLFTRQNTAESISSKIHSSISSNIKNVSNSIFYMNLNEKKVPHLDLSKRNLTSLSEEYSQTHINEITRVSKILKETRALFKGSPFKCGNKIRFNRTIEQHKECIDRLSMIRKSDNLSDHLIQSIKSKTGNCGELAYIAYALLHNSGFDADYIIFDDLKNKRFDHAICQVEILGEKYYVDPWFNIFCKKTDYSDVILEKANIWRENGKHISARLVWDEIEKYLKYNDSQFLSSFEIKNEDLQNLTKIIEGKVISSDLPITSVQFIEKIRSIQ